MGKRFISFLDHRFTRLSSLVFLLLFIGHCSILAAPVFDPDAPPPTEENFDPAEADPRNNITCLGDKPDLQLPILHGFDPNQVTMQKLCAKPQYNGGPPGKHIGGYCNGQPDRYRPGGVAFDLSRAAQANKQLQNPRLLLACSYRCFCNYGLADTSVKPKTGRLPYRRPLEPSRSTYELQLDINNDFSRPISRKRGKRGYTSVPVAQVNNFPEISQPWEPLWFLRDQCHDDGVCDDLSLDSGNEIQCSGDLPTFILPSPYTTADFTSLQQMCATEPNGGNGYANAGGYCHRSNTDDDPRNTVWFSDDMTPRLEWTWPGGNLFASAAIRYWCWRRCQCKENPTKDNATVGLWAIVQGHEMAYRTSGAMYIRATGPVAKGQPRETQVLPPQHGTGSPSGTCGPSGREFCPQQWDEAVYGAVPRTPPGATDIVKPPPPNSNSTVCGNECNSISDCGSPDAVGFSCSCALPSMPDAKKLGLDPVAPTAICLALFASSLKTSQLGGKREILGEGAGTSSLIDVRNVPAYVDERGMPYTCKCNETFTADACCRSRNGIVYSQ